MTVLDLATDTKRVIINRTKIPYLKDRYDYYVNYYFWNTITDCWCQNGYYNKPITSKPTALHIAKSYLYEAKPKTTHDPR